MWINRIISKKLSALVGSFPAVVVTGARQTGKTSLLKKSFPDYNFVSLDLPSMAEFAETQPIEFLKKYPPPLIIDEIQYAPNIFRHLKVKIDEARTSYGKFILTGSQKFTLMKEISDSLAGRCAILEIETLSLTEINPQLGPESYATMIQRGGFPELYGRPDLDSYDYYNGYIATYLERDVRSLIKVSTLRDFERFLRACAMRSGQLLNKSELARDVGISSPTANEWLSVLHASNQVILLEPWFYNRTKSLVKSPKLYMADTGILCHLLNIKSATELTNSPYVGHIWETFVFSELRKRSLNSRGAYELWYWRDKQGNEVDFLEQAGGLFHLYETKWSENPTSKDLQAMQKVSSDIGEKNVLSMQLICRTAKPYKKTMSDSQTATVVNLNQ